MKANLPPDLESLTERIIGAGLDVFHALGHGFLESVYKKALLRQFSVSGLFVASEVPFRITDLGEVVGTYVADLVVENRVIVELKAVDALAAVHRAQLLNYLKASRVPVGLLLNFGAPRLEIKRVLL